jgi:hypothetical protein
MALCPFAKHLLIPPGDSDPRITPRVAILHVDAGNAASLYDYFKNRSGGIESHFHVRADGVIEQYRDTAYQADANNLANDFAVSIETQGYGDGEWNDLQLASIKRLLLWLSEVHPIPLRECATWNGSGVGYHTLFGAPSEWTPVAKSCPGEDRKKQFRDDIVPWMKTGGDDMAEYGEKILAAIKRLEERDKAREKRYHDAVLALLDKLADDVQDDASRAQVKRLRVAVEALAAPDVEPEPET